MSMVFVVLLGPPGAGKGTQAAILASALGLAHISTGDLFRALKTQDTDFAREVQAIMARGELVPDAATVQMVRDRLKQDDCKAGAIMDGFPRTTAQADAFAEMLKQEFGAGITVVLQVIVTEDELVTRIVDRAEKARAAGQAVRADDTADGARKRFQVYMSETAPLVAYYSARGLLVEIDGMREIEQITPELEAAIRARM